MRKKALALTSLLIALLASFAMFPKPVMAPWATTSYDTDGDATNDVDVRNDTVPLRQIHIDLDRDGVIDPGEPHHNQTVGAWSYGQPGGPGTALRVIVDDRLGRWNYTVRNLNGDGDTSDWGECNKSFTARYVVMGGELNSWTQLDEFPVSQSPYTTRAPRYTPNLMSQNITFSEPWYYNATYGWIVNLTIPYDTYVGVYHEWYDDASGLYFNLQNYLLTDGYGWVFLNDSCGDVDCYTFNNSTGTYWKSPSLKAGQLAALTGDVPDVGPDGVAGTGDDGFGDGTKDLKGSGVMIMPARLRCNWTDGILPWQDLFDIDWPIVTTSGTAYDIVNDATSLINGKNATMTGYRWEFLAGVQGSPPYKGPVPYCHPKWNAFNLVACAWSMINITTATYGRLDVMFYFTQKVVRQDCVIADVDCNQLVNILDVLVASVCFGAEDEALGRPSATRGAGGGLFDARADLASPRGLINILDVLKMSVDFGKMITPQCVIRP